VLFGQAAGDVSKGQHWSSGSGISPFSCTHSLFKDFLFF